MPAWAPLPTDEMSPPSVTRQISPSYSLSFAFRANCCHNCDLLFVFKQFLLYFLRMVKFSKVIQPHDDNICWDASRPLLLQFQSFCNEFQSNCPIGIVEPLTLRLVQLLIRVKCDTSADRVKEFPTAESPAPETFNAGYQELKRVLLANPASGDGGSRRKITVWFQELLAVFDPCRPQLNSVPNMRFYVLPLAAIWFRPPLTFAHQNKDQNVLDAFYVQAAALDPTSDLRSALASDLARDTLDGIAVSIAQSLQPLAHRMVQVLDRWAPATVDSDDASGTESLDDSEEGSGEPAATPPRKRQRPDEAPASARVPEALSPHRAAAGDTAGAPRRLLSAAEVTRLFSPATPRAMHGVDDDGESNPSTNLPGREEQRSAGALIPILAHYTMHDAKQLLEHCDFARGISPDELVRLWEQSEFILIAGDLRCSVRGPRGQRSMAGVVSTTMRLAHDPNDIVQELARSVAPPQYTEGEASQRASDASALIMRLRSLAASYARIAPSSGSPLQRALAWWTLVANVWVTPLAYCLKASFSGALDLIPQPLHPTTWWRTAEEHKLRRALEDLTHLAAAVSDDLIQPLFPTCPQLIVRSSVTSSALGSSPPVPATAPRKSNRRGVRGSGRGGGAAGGDNGGRGSHGGRGHYVSSGASRPPATASASPASASGRPLN